MYDIKLINARFPNYDTDDFDINDICIKDGKIAKIGKTDVGAKVELDVQGLTTAPGFIDIHMHEEELDKYKNLSRFYVAERMLKMGVTTALAGNCGINYQDPEVFIGQVNKYNTPINYMLKLGYNTMRHNVGIESPYGKMTEEKMDRLLKNIQSGLKLGVKGLSFGIEYSPGIDYEEMLRACKVLESDEYLVSAHYRDDGENSIDAIDEMIMLSKESGIPMQISHIGSGCAYGYMDRALERIEEARNKGLSIMTDCYPYNAFCTYIGSTVFEDGCLERWNRDYNNILLTEEPYKNVYCNEEIFKQVRMEYPDMLAVAFVMDEEEVLKALKAPFNMIGSDEIYNGDKGHPRGAGTFPRILGKYVREDGSMSEIEALYKMTKLPAERLLLKKKGEIKEGFDADITIYNAENIMDKASFLAPIEQPVGIEYVIVDGQLALKDNTIVNDTAGRYFT